MYLIKGRLLRFIVRTQVADIAKSLYLPPNWNLIYIGSFKGFIKVRYCWVFPFNGDVVIFSDLAKVFFENNTCNCPSRTKKSMLQ